MRPVVLACLLAACGQNASNVPDAGTPDAASQVAELDYGFAFPDEEGMDARPLVDLATWVRDGDLPILSILISRNGKVVFELYTSGLTREEAHYLMSVTKSFTSAVYGAAIDQQLIGPPDTTVADALPASVFADASQHDRFAAVTMRDVLGMSALDAEVPPHRSLPEDVQRQKDFLAAPNRVKFALTQQLLPQPGVSYQYTDITPYLATGVLEYASGVTELELAEKHFFGPMDFHNYEWMHEDPSGIDNGAYGLRLRPVDMQKFGVLFLNEGLWAGQRLLSREWVERSFTPWIKSADTLAADNYGWYWWTQKFGDGWTARIADGWKGQRIAVVPEQNVVVTMTAIIEAADGDEHAAFTKVMKDYVIPSLAGAPDATQRAALTDVLQQVDAAPSKIKPTVEPRMVPSIAPKEQHRPFLPL